MQLTLKPLSHPELDEIVIRDRLFPIGRHEAPFDSFQDEAVARLSRRHARIFIQDDAFYLVDLDSLNGTTVNGASLDKQSKQLRQDDEICFAGQLSFRIELEGGDTSGIQASNNIILALLPQQLQSVLEPIVIADFPFLLSKSDELFSRYRSQIPDQYNFLSRRHAHFFVRDGKLLLEDLGSTNGTFVCDTRLDEHARILQDGDTVAFGGNDFVYKVRLKTLKQDDEQRLDQADIVTEVVDTSTDVTRTTFISSATSFIDIFCAPDDEEEEAFKDEEIDSGASDRRQRAEPGRAADTAPERQRSRLSIFWGELRHAFRSDEKPANRYALWMTLGVLTLAAALIGLSFMQNAAMRSIEQQLEDGAYANAAREANAYLLEHPDDAEIEELALRATSLHVLPAWIGHLNASDFTKARESIDQARKLDSNNKLAKPFLDLMEWVTAEEAFFQQRGGQDAPIALYKDEATIEGLIEGWDRQSNEHQRMASRIVQYVPAFEAVNARALSHLRTLRNEKSLYLVAMNELKQQIETLLQADRTVAIEKLLTDFNKKYPRISGVDNLLTDLKDYRLVQKAIKQFAWVDASGLLNNINFLTPPFRDRAAEIRDHQLPPMSVAAEYQLAAELWQQGQGDQSIDTLQNLTQGRWGDMARQILEHRRSVWEGYKALATGKDDADYPERLLAFYESLEPAADAYYLNRLKPEYASYREKALQMARQAIHSAENSWNDYRQHGRISGLLRLEATISRQYKDQAKRLSDALAQATRGIGIFHLLHQTPEADLQAVYQEILQESRLQRRSMQELKMVLDTRLFEGKIALLPQTQ